MFGTSPLSKKIAIKIKKISVLETHQAARAVGLDLAILANCLFLFFSLQIKVIVLMLQFPLPSFQLNDVETV